MLDLDTVYNKHITALIEIVLNKVWHRHKPCLKHSEDDDGSDDDVILINTILTVSDSCVTHPLIIPLSMVNVQLQQFSSLGAEISISLSF